MFLPYNFLNDVYVLQCHSVFFFRFFFVEKRERTVAYFWNYFTWTLLCIEMCEVLSVILFACFKIKSFSVLIWVVIEIYAYFHAYCLLFLSELKTNLHRCYVYCIYICSLIRSSSRNPNLSLNIRYNNVSRAPKLANAVHRFGPLKLSILQRATIISF